MILLEDQIESTIIDHGDEGAANKKHSLYLRFPKKLNVDRTLAESEVKSLNSKIIRVRIPRQRSANFCLVDFESKDEKEKALKKLKKVEINDKRLVVKEAVRNDKGKVHKRIEKTRVKREVNEALGKLVNDIRNSLDKKYAKRNVTNGVMVRDLKAATTQSDLRKLFPQAIDIKVIMKPERKNSFALVWLPTPKDATVLAATESVRINGEDHVVSLQNDGKQQKRKRGNDSMEYDGDSSEDGSASEGSDASEESDASEGSDVDVDVDENVDSENESD